MATIKKKFDWGRWDHSNTKDYTFIFCEECDFFMIFPRDSPKIEYFNFCPNCGKVHREPKTHKHDDTLRVCADYVKKNTDKGEED